VLEEGIHSGLPALQLTGAGTQCNMQFILHVIVAVTSLLLNTDLIPVLQNLNKKVFVLN
jgi:hypothetical protein